MGLWISKMIVELMGGSILLESEENHGSRFTIKLKMKVCKSEYSSSSSSDNVRRAISLFSNSVMSHGHHLNSSMPSIKRLLVLSDIFTVRLLKSYVEAKNFRIVRVTTIEELKEEIQDDNNSRRCIFFDEDYQDVVKQYLKCKER